MDLEEEVRIQIRELVDIQTRMEAEEEENRTRQRNIVKSEFKQFDTIKDEFFTDHHYYYDHQKNLNHQTIESISRECDILKQGLPDCIFVRANKVKPDLLRAVIIGPEGTPHHDGLFFYDIYLPSKFPDESPKIRSFHAGGLHECNIPSPCPWSPSTSTILESLRSIRRYQIFRANFIHINEMATLLDNELAYKFNWSTMVDVLNKPPRYFENFVARHFHDRAEKILTTCKAYIHKRVNTVDHPVIRVPWQDEFNVMEKHYNKLVDAFQKNGSSVADLSKLGIEFHGESSWGTGMQLAGWAAVIIVTLGALPVACYIITKI